MTLLVNDQTEFRAQATFLRTVVTRNTPFDRFLAGDNGALTEGQRRGAKLFFTPPQTAGRGRLLLVPQRTDAQQAGQ